jgi:hypothetical protein
VHDDKLTIQNTYESETYIPYSHSDLLAIKVY